MRAGAPSRRTRRRDRRAARPRAPPAGSPARARRARTASPSGADRSRLRDVRRCSDPIGVPVAKQPTPIGVLTLVGSDAGVSAVQFPGSRLPAEGGCTVLDEAAAQLDAYFAGELIEFDLP